MSPDQPVILDIATLNAIAARLFDHAESITSVVHQDMADDLMVATRIAATLASLRFHVAAIAERALTENGAAIRRDLLAVLDEATRRIP